MAGDADHDEAGAGVEVTYKGQLYRRIAIRPHSRVDGSTTQFAIWESRCPVCGEPFQFTSTRTTKLRSPTRRCPAHRAPGRRVVFESQHCDRPSK